MKSIFFRPATEYAALTLSLLSVISFLCIWFSR